jgi:hypothetical protein
MKCIVDQALSTSKMFFFATGLNKTTELES